MQTLREIFEKYAHYGSDAGHADKGSTHSYIEEYAKLFSPFRPCCRFMEIGLALGWSLKMWCEYFKDSDIFGVDISIVFPTDDGFFSNPPNKNICHIIEADATKVGFLGKIGRLKFNIIVDDGSHMENDQVATFELLKNNMAEGGLYIIEDILALEHNRERFISLHDNCEVIDLRKVKGRFDDVLIVYRF